MTDRSLENQNSHDSLVRSLVKHYSSLGYKGIRADIPGSTETPTSVYWKSKPENKYIPDITCFKNDPANTAVITEAETCETLRNPHTAEQWKLFAAHAKNVKGEFHVITPKICAEVAKAVAQELSIGVTTFWVI